MAKVLIGTSGYNYPHWADGVFYPKDLPQSKWLEHYCKYFDTVELNVTFYHLPQEKVFEGWHKRTQKNFLFTIKGSRFITHIKKLKDCRGPLALLAERAKNLKEKLGMILWQLPPQLKVDISKLKDFCQLLNSKFPKIRQTFEFRHQSWFSKDVYDILKKHNFALVICDYPFELMTEKRKPWGKRKTIIILETADFIYLRRHGPPATPGRSNGGRGASALYSSNYSDKQLRQDTEQIKKWTKAKKDVYVYFNNDAAGYAVKNGLKLKKIYAKC